jgi:hypothetical protein
MAGVAFVGFELMCDGIEHAMVCWIPIHYLTEMESGSSMKI